MCILSYYDTLPITINNSDFGTNVNDYEHYIVTLAFVN